MVLSSPGGVSRPRSGRRQRRPRCCPRVAWVSLSVAVAAAVATLKSSALFSVASCVDGSIPARNLSAAALLGRNEEAPSSQLGTASRLSPARIFAACASIGGNPLMVSEKPGPWGVSRPRDPRRRHLHSYFSFPATSASPVAPGCGCVLPVPSSTQTALLLTAPPATRRRLQSRTRAGGQTKTPLRLVLATPTAVKAASLPSGLTSKAQAVSAAVQPALQAAGAQRGGPAVTLSPISRTKSVAAAVRVPRDTLPTSSIAAILQKFPVSETAWRASYMPHVLPVASRAARPWLSCFASTFAFWSGGEASIEFSRKKSRLVTSSHVPTSLHLGSTLRRSWWSGACSSGSPAAASTIPSTLFPCGTVSPVHRALAGLSAAAAARAARTSLRSLGLVFTPEFTSVCGASPTAAATAGSSVAAVFPSAQCLVSATLTSVVSVQGVIAGAAGGLLPQPTFYEDHFRRRQQQQRLRFVFASNLATMRQADDITELQKEQARDKCCTTVRTVGADWRMPSKDGKLITGLIVNNSVAGGKVEFVPQEGNRVCWYACGPTVYDASHMGHARTYVTFDCIRRIMSDYFNYDVFLCMNITDIDDKIIKRSQEQGVNFMEVARHWEKEFFADLATLNVRLPTVVTRVSEHIPEVLALVGRILKNGYAYESQGSVYFDTQAFGGSHKHVYGRMEPSSVADEERALEGEGELGVTSSEKRHPCDFALWKKAKEGEPSWNSPWGKGRPGWHIECSAMADSVFPFPLDIHSGGIDLRFPHHDNELAQSEAANDRPHWVNYFLHSGHLHIQGAKMSKSLKNFITIKECLTRFSPRHIRLLCLMNRWDSLMNYNPDGDTMQQAVDVDRGFVDFFALVRAKLRDAMPISAHEQKWGPSEVALSDELHSAKEQVHRCLQDNFNTPGALVALQRLVSSANTYLNRHTGGCVRAPLVRAVAQYVFRMLRIFGVVKDEDGNMQYSNAPPVTQGAAASAEGDMEESLLECIGSFREQVRAFAANTLRSLQLQQRKSNAADQAPSEGPASANARNDAAGRGSEGQPGEAAFPNGALRSAVSPQNVKDLLRACDELRDQRLRALGILLQDRPDGTFVIKRVSKEELDRETEFKAEEERKRSEQRKERLRKEAELQEKKKVERQTAPQDYYRVLYGDQYATYDAEGVPLTLKSGDPVSKSQRQKMQKFLQKHAKLYNEAQEADSDVKRSDELSPE